MVDLLYVVLAFVYLVAGFLCVLAVNDEEIMQDMERPARIAARIAVILLWPLILVVGAIRLIAREILD